MGKLRKTRAKASTGKQTNAKGGETKVNIPPVPQILQLIPKDADLESIRSFKTIKNKFGIQKQIKKSQKIKVKKEILKNKIGLIKQNSDLSRNIKNKKHKESAEKSEDNTILSKFLNEKVVKKKMVPDPNEEYVKLNNKVKGIQKKGRRQKQNTKDVNTLKHLMMKAKHKTTA